MCRRSALWVIVLATCLLLCPESCNASSGSPRSVRSTQGSSSSSGGSTWKFWQNGSKNKDRSGYGVPADDEFTYLQRYKPKAPPDVKVHSEYSKPFDAAGKPRSNPPLAGSKDGSSARGSVTGSDRAHAATSLTDKAKAGFNNFKGYFNKGKGTDTRSPLGQGSPPPGQPGVRVRRYPPPTTPPPPPPVQGIAIPKHWQPNPQREHIYDLPLKPGDQQGGRQRNSAGYAKPYKGKDRFSPGTQSLPSSNYYESIDRSKRLPSGHYETIGNSNRQPTVGRFEDHETLGKYNKEGQTGGRNHQPKLSQAETDNLYARPDLAAKRNRRFRDS